MDFPADWLPGASLTLSAAPAPHTDESRQEQPSFRVILRP